MPKRRSITTNLTVALVLSALFFFSPLASSAAGDASPAGKDRPIVIIGASYAKGWNAPQLAGRPVINVGIGGQESHEVAARFEKDALTAQPAAVIVWGFINDITRSTPEALPARKEAIKKNLTQMVDAARRANVTPILATEVTLGSKGSFTDKAMAWLGKLLGKRSYANNINAHVQYVNNWVRQYAKSNGIVLLDIQPVLAEPDDMRKSEYTKEDGSHLTPAAYEALTKYAEPELTRAFSEVEKTTAKR